MNELPAHKRDYIDPARYEPVTSIQVCPRISVRELMERGVPIPNRFFARLEQRQDLKSCCRNPEAHDIVAFASSPDQPAPDTYIFICDCCGNYQQAFCVGELCDCPSCEGDRPVWE